MPSSLIHPLLVYYMIYLLTLLYGKILSWTIQTSMKKHVSESQVIAILFLYIAWFFCNERQIMLGLHLVGDNTRAVYNSCCARQVELATWDAIFDVIVSRPLIVNTALFVRISKFVKCNVIYIVAFGVLHWIAWDDSFCITRCYWACKLQVSYGYTNGQPCVAISVTYDRPHHKVSGIEYFKQM